MFDIIMQDYLKEQKTELGELYSRNVEQQLINEYYNLICESMRQGDVISQRVYNNLEKGQQWHFNKHYNFRGDKVI